ncbi:hypothetical protein INR49_004477 [Caranx melampygus]|nr:hypothetical protein INR49_004477 [Caranx melampygus]
MLFMDDDPVFAVPWRKVKWGHKESDLRYVNDYKPQSEYQRLRVLLYGPRGAGKSSFINSVQSALRGRMCMEAEVYNGVDGLSTDKYSTHMIQKGSPKSFYPFVFTDTLGLDRDKGVQVDDIKLALMGHVKEGYKFNPESKLSKGSEFYKKSPADEDKVHVLVCVAPVDICMHSERKTLEKIRDIRSETSRLGIPHVVILTKVDMASPETERDIRNIYKSQYLKDKMEEFSTKVGFPMNCIFPVKNYHNEIDVSENTDSVILSALKCIINYGDDFLNRSVE